MGCVASKLEEEEEVVAICRERKRQLKLAVERRYVLADAHCRYCQSLYAVAAAIKLFVARHSTPSSPFLITFPPPTSSSSSPPPPPPPPPQLENVRTNPMFLQQTPSEPTQKTLSCEDHHRHHHRHPLPSHSSTTSSDSSEEEREAELEREDEQGGEQEQVCGYFYMQMPPPMPSPQRDFGWDFFNPFNGGAGRPEVINRYNNNRCTEEDLRVVREQEGIPDLEEEEVEEEEEEEDEEEEDIENVQDKVVVVEENGNGQFEKQSGFEVVGNANVSQEGDEHQKGLTVMDNPEMGRELLEALKDIEDHFNRAYDSGKDVSRMLEANRFHFHSNLEEIKENSTKLIQAIAWNRSTSSRSSSCKSLVASSSSKSSSTWTEFSNDLFDDYGGMTSGSHSLTLGRLYAWEKKLYEEVKAGDNTRKIYERKCSQLRNHDVRGDDMLVMDKTRAAVKDLYARILVAIRSAESISRRIQKLRDEELQPQIVELLQGLMRTWKVMLDSHETQNRILFEVKTFTCPTYGKFCNDSHRLATLQLEAELQNWRACYTEYVAAQKGYVEAIYGWLSKFVAPEVEFCSKSKNSAPLYRVNGGPPLLVICHDWLASIEKLPHKTVALAMKSFAKDVRALWVQQGEEQQQKRKVDSLAKELDRKLLTFHKAEKRMVESKLLTLKMEPERHEDDDCFTEKKDHLDILKRKLDIEKEKHLNCMQETQRITLIGFQTGFSTIFESLTEFSKESLKMYSDLVSYSENAEKVREDDCSLNIGESKNGFFQGN